MAKQPNDDTRVSNLERAGRDQRSFGLNMPPATRRLMGAGMELAGYALILGGAGYLVDMQVGWQQPYLGVAGVVGGFALGFVRLIVIVNRLGNQDSSGDDSERSS